MFSGVVVGEDVAKELSVCDGVMDKGDEATSPSLRSILAENRIVRERRQLAGGGELGFLYAGDEDILVM